MTKTFRYALFASIFLLSLLASASAERFPVLGNLPDKPREAVTTLLEWQNSLVDQKATEVEARLGKPDKSVDSGINPVSGKPMKLISYCLSRWSELRITVHDGDVVAVTTILLPSANENGPLDD